LKGAFPKPPESAFQYVVVIQTAFADPRAPWG